MKKLIIALSFLAVATAVSAKTETPSQTEAKAHTYYVVGISGSNYLLASSPDDPSLCEEITGSPCKITSTNAMSGTAPKSQVDNETNGFSIETWQPKLQ